jgi:hypothetical protein
MHTEELEAEARALSRVREWLHDMRAQRAQGKLIDEADLDDLANLLIGGARIARKEDASVRGALYRVGITVQLGREGRMPVKCIRYVHADSAEDAELGAKLDVARSYPHLMQDPERFEVTENTRGEFQPVPEGDP